MTIQLFLLAVGTVGLTALSWRSLRHPRSHGFYRFFAFEGVLVLALLNVPSWFRHPLSLPQLVSWTLLLASIFLVVSSVNALRRVGASTDEPIDGPDFRFERTSRLVTTGVYRLMRHPMYASLLYLAWGAFFKRMTGFTLAVALVTTAALVATARAEERENVERFGQAYREYAGRTKRFVPFVW